MTHALPPLDLRRRPAAKLALVAAACAALSACSSLAPSYSRPAAPVPAALPVVSPADAAASAAAAPATTTAPLAWADFVTSPALRELVQRALKNNRDLRVALLNVQRAEAQLGLSRAERWPNIGLGVTASRAPNPSTGAQANTYTAGLQVSAWELDFFGRYASLNDAAQAQLLASEAGRRSAELSLVSAVLTGAINVSANTELLDLAERTLQGREASLRLTRAKFDVGAASQIELSTADTLVAQARAARAQALRQQTQELNALGLLLGEPVTLQAVPVNDNASTWLAEVPVGLDSSVLLRRPDVVQAEQQLIAANANIGAARAAFFPRVTLTAQAGLASTSLSNLLEAGSSAWTLAPQALLSIFDFGRNRANLDASKVGRDIAVAQYEKAVQSAFRDTADALAGLATWRDQVAAQRQQLLGAREIARLTELRFNNGAASELERLDAQRSLFATEQALVQTRVAELSNRIALFKALGG